MTKKKRIVYRGFLGYLLTGTPTHLIDFSPLESLRFASDPEDVKLTKNKYTSMGQDPCFLVRAKHGLIKDILAWAEPTGEE